MNGCLYVLAVPAGSIAGKYCWQVLPTYTAYNNGISLHKWFWSGQWIYYITTNFNRPFIVVFITYVSYADIEIKLEPSDEEFTDCVGKLKSILEMDKIYSSVVLLLLWFECGDKMGQ